MQYKDSKISFRLIQWATVGLFLGRAWQHLFWDAPFRILLWDEAWMKGIVEGFFNTPWESYITNLNVDDAIQWSIQGFGVFYLICAFIAAFINILPKWTAKILYLGSASLFVLAMLYCKERFFSLGQFFEYSLQIVSPLLLYFLVYPKYSIRNFQLMAKIVIALTFTCHGLYAVNYYPRPGNFVDMVINTLGVSETMANQLLLVAGILDFVVSIAIFLPGRTARIALSYVVCWGFATTFSRYTSYIEWSYFLESMNQWTWQVLIRLPHFMVPLAILLYSRNESTPEVTNLRKDTYEQPSLSTES